MEKARYKGYFFEASKDQGQFPDSPIKIINSTTDNLEDHHVSLDVYCGEDKLQRVEIFIRVTKDEKLEIIANKVEHWEYEGRPEDGDYEIYSVQPDGSNLANLTKRPSNTEIWPYFQPWPN